MASLIDSTYNILKNLFEKHGRGYLSPDAYNDACIYVQAKLIREAFDFLNNIRNNEKIGRITKRNFDKEKYYTEITRLLISNETLTYSSGTETFAFPSDYSFSKAMYYDGVEVEEISNDERIVLNNVATMPTVTYPLYIEHATTIEVLPDTIIADVVLYYYIDAPTPLWTSTTVSGKPLFNIDASDYQDFSLPEQIIDLIIVELAEYFGVVLKQPDVVQMFMKVDGQNEELKRVN